MDMQTDAISLVNRGHKYAFWIQPLNPDRNRFRERHSFMWQGRQRILEGGVSPTTYYTNDEALKQTLEQEYQIHGDPESPPVFIFRSPKEAQKEARARALEAKILTADGNVLGQTTGTELVGDILEELRALRLQNEQLAARLAEFESTGKPAADAAAPAPEERKARRAPRRKAQAETPSE